MRRRLHRAGTVVSVSGRVVGVLAGATAETLRGRGRPRRTPPVTPVPIIVAETPETSPDTELGAFGVQPASEWVDGVEIHLPAPSVWPMVLGLGITFLAFGIVTNVVISAFGVFLILWALQGWIRELRHA